MNNEPKDPTPCTECRSTAVIVNGELRGRTHEMGCGNGRLALKAETPKPYRYATIDGTTFAVYRTEDVGRVLQEAYGNQRIVHTDPDAFVLNERVTTSNGDAWYVQRHEIHGGKDGACDTVTFLRDWRAVKPPPTIPLAALDGSHRAADFIPAGRVLTLGADGQLRAMLKVGDRVRVNVGAARVFDGKTGTIRDGAGKEGKPHVVHFDDWSDSQCYCFARQELELLPAEEGRDIASSDGPARLIAGDGDCRAPAAAEPIPFKPGDRVRFGKTVWPGVVRTGTITEIDEANRMVEIDEPPGPPMGGPWWAVGEVELADTVKAGDPVTFDGQLGKVLPGGAGQTMSVKWTEMVTAPLGAIHRPALSVGDRVYAKNRQCDGTVVETLINSVLSEPAYAVRLDGRDVTLWFSRDGLDLKPPVGTCPGCRAQAYALADGTFALSHGKNCNSPGALDAINAYVYSLPPQPPGHAPGNPDERHPLQDGNSVTVTAVRDKQTGETATRYRTKPVEIEVVEHNPEHGIRGTVTIRQLEKPAGVSLDVITADTLERYFEAVTDKASGDNAGLASQSADQLRYLLMLSMARNAEVMAALSRTEQERDAANIRWAAACAKERAVNPMMTGVPTAPGDRIRVVNQDPSGPFPDGDYVAKTPDKWAKRAPPDDDDGWPMADVQDPDE